MRKNIYVTNFTSPNDAKVFPVKQYKHFDRERLKLIKIYKLSNGMYFSKITNLDRDTLCPFTLKSFWTEETLYIFKAILEMELDRVGIINT